MLIGRCTASRGLAHPVQQRLAVGPSTGYHGAPARSAALTCAARRFRIPTVFSKKEEEPGGDVYFSSEVADIDPAEVATLWEVALGRDRPDVQKMQTALTHSFSVEAAFVDVPYEDPYDSPAGSSPSENDSRQQSGANAESFRSPVSLTGNSRRRSLPPGQRRRLVGFVRCLSDGAFAALVVDACVHPEFQRQGIGRKLMKRLLSNTRKRGPSTFVAFPRPKERMFFWRMQFDINRKFTIMRYKELPEPSETIDDTILGTDTGSIDTTILHEENDSTN